MIHASTKMVSMAIALWLLWGGAGFGLPLAGSDPARDTGHVTLASEVRIVAPGSTFLVDLHFDLPRGWHTYWRFAGDSGAPPRLEWRLPAGFRAGEIMWPLPRRIGLGQFMDFGYESEADLLVPIFAPPNLTPGSRVAIRLGARWLVCSAQVCVPRSGNFEIVLPVGERGAAPEGDPIWRDRLTVVSRSLPRPPPFQIDYAVDSKDLVFLVRDDAMADGVRNGGAKLEFYPYEDGIIHHEKPQIAAANEDFAALRIPYSYAIEKGQAKRPLQGLLIIERGGVREGFEISAAHIALPPGLKAAASSPGGQRGSLLLALAFAFLGGTLLNLMPCVFPVLSLKILAALNHGAQGGARLRQFGRAYAAGILACFAILAAGFYGLRFFGAAVGWGFQLQLPIVVALLAYLMFAIGLSLLGALTIGSEFLPRFIGAGDGSGKADFWTGALIVLVATPCTAPFMGAALGFALTATPAVGSLVFLALGLGLASPYLVITHVPALYRFMPRPGAWMVRLKQILSVPMFAAALWLVFVLEQQAGLAGAVIGGVGLSLILIACLAAKFAGLWLGRAAAIAAIGLPLGYFFLLPPKTGARHELGLSADTWVPYSPASLASAINSGRPVFVDITAAWCLTCKVNEAAALSSARVRRAFAAHGVTAIRGDWTTRDDNITALLAQNGRIGVPLYLYYPGPGKPVQILPQILTEESVLKLIDQ